MSTSLVKFADRRGSGDKKLFWDRAPEDGLPFRGPAPPFMPEEEYQERVVRIADARNAFFDVTVPEQNQAYLAVLDACVNQWFQMLHIVRFWNGTTKHYVEWTEYYLEDGKTRTPFMSGGIVELANGQANVTGNP